jgi:GH25 family lysozyme M1 (1,4-beta-N-acetylmuramidase)
MPNAQGVDVSHWKPVRDFDELIAGRVSFLGIKASQGGAYRDPTLAAHRDGRRARAASLVGAIFYHFPAGGSPAQEAANFLGAIGELRDDERLCLDVEQGPTGLGAPSFDWIREFVAELPQDRNRVPLIYTAQHVWNEIGNPPWPDATVGKVDLWVKQYGPELTKLPSPWTFARFWQRSEGGAARGIGGPCDLDEFTGGGVDELRRYFTLVVA